MPSRNRPGSQSSVSVLPNQLRIGDCLTNEEGEWEVASRPVTYKQGHEVRARIQRPRDPGTAREMTWPAYERLTIRRDDLA